MARYKLTKKNISRIRHDRAGCEDLISQGYTFVGEADENNDVIDDRIRLADIGEKQAGDPEKDALVAQAKEIGLGAPSQLKRLSVDTLRERIAEAEEE